MDAEDLLTEIRPGDLMNPPDWDNPNAFDEVLEVRRASRRGELGLERQNFIEVVSRRTVWLLDPDEQVKVVRP